MGATHNVDDSEFASVLSGTHLPTSEGWKAELASERGGDLVVWDPKTKLQIVQL